MPFEKLRNVLKTYVPGLQNAKEKVLCDVCPLARQTRASLSDSINNAKAPFDLLHTDVCGPFNTPTINGAKYFFDYCR